MAKKAEVIITCDASTVKQVLAGLNREMDKTKQRRQELQKMQEQGTKLTKTEQRELQQLIKYENALNEKTQKSEKDMRKFGEVMKDLSGSKLKDLKRALQEGKNALNKMSERDSGREKLVHDLKRIQEQIEKNTGAVKAQGSAFATTAKNLAVYMAGFAGFNKIKGMIEDVFQSNLKLSDSLANIRKVSGLSGEAINQLYRNIAQIDSRNTIETLNNLAYTGAKLGIGQNYGVSGLTGFVKAAEQVQMALGEDMGEDALPALAKMTEVMGLIDKYGVEQSMQKAASAIFQLGATSTATGTNIVEFSKRLYGLANVSRISSDDLLALGSAADAMGLMPEVAATAFNKLFTSVQKNHNMIEKTLNLQPGLIKSYYDQGKTMDAIVKIFERMNETGNLNLLGSVFKDLGSDGARLVNVMATMSDRVDILRKHLETSRDAFKEGEAVIGEYMIQNQTAAAMVERASNLWAKAFTNPEGVDMVKELAKAWYDLSKGMTQSEVMMSSLHTSINAIATAIGALIKSLPVLIRLAMTFGAVVAFKEAILGVKALGTAIKMIYYDLVAAKGAATALTTAFKSNAVLLAISAVATAITLAVDALRSANEQAERAAEKQKELEKSFAASKDAVNNSVRSLETYKKVIDNANLSEEQRRQAIKDFRTTYQDYLDYLGIEINTVEDLAKAYLLVAKAMKQKKAYEERESYRTQVNGQNRMDRIANQAQVEAQLQSMGITGVDKNWLQKNQWRGTQGMYAAIMQQQYGGNLGLQGNGAHWRIRTSDGKYKNVGNEQLYDLLTEYITSYRNERDLNKQIDKMFNSEYKDIDLEHFNIDTFNKKVEEARWKRKGSLDNEAPDKDALKQARKEEAERRKQLRAEMKEEQQQAKAIIDNVRNYYQRQINAVTDMATETGMSSELQKQTVAGLQQRMNDALANVRKAIGGTKNDWDAFKQTMRDDLYEPLNESGTNLSTELLDKIVDNDIVKLRTMIEKLSKELNQQGSVLLDQILRKASANEGQNAKIDNTFARLREKELLAKNYTGKVELDYENVMEQFGIAGINDAQSRQIRDWSKGNQDEDIKAFFEERTALWRTAFNNARENLVQLLQTDISSKEGQEGALKLLFGEDYDTALAGSSLQGVLDMSADQWQVFYMKLIEMTDAWTDAQKKAYDEVKNREDYIFKNRPDIITLDANAQSLDRANTEFNRFGSPATFGRQMGIVDTIENDPEIMRLQLLQQRAEMYYDRMKELREQDKISEEQLKQAKDSLYEAQMATQARMTEAIKERVETIKNAIQPVTEFAEDAGQKLGDMIFNMQSQSMTWNQIWKKMVLALAKATLQMGAQWLTQKIQQALFYKQMEADETMHQTLMTTIALQGAMARVQGEATIGAIGLGTNAAQNTVEVGQEVSMATILTSLGISKGAAKIIGKLGWWGIPLVAVITSLLMGLLTSALSTAGAESAAATAAPDIKSDASTPKINSKLRLGKGMLTYDEGNVKRFVGDDGKVYTAREDMDPGTGLVTHPIATTVQGQPALVAEKGPEIVVGRETTRNIMMNEPELIRYLAEYDKHHGRYQLPVFDAGNVAGATEATPTPVNNDNNSVSQTLTALNQTLTMLQQQIAAGIRANINMYGTDGLYEQHKKAEAFMKRYS